MGKINILGRTFSWGRTNLAVPPSAAINTRKALPPGRQSIPDNNNSALGFLSPQFNIINPDYSIQFIPIIRTLCYTNPDLSQALDNIIQLGNSGHEISFDSGVDETEANLMREHLNARKLEWAEGNAGMDGLVNKMIAQILIAGALSTEWIPNSSLTGIDKCALINPETIRFVFDKKTQKYLPYQQPLHNVLQGKIASISEMGLVKLNTNTYKYYGLNGDSEVPYGIPPYLPTLAPLQNQKSMLESINYMVENLGIMGFLAVNIEKPDKYDDESETAYITRLESYLASLKTRLESGLKDSLVTGYKDDTEFQFHTFTRDMAGVNEIFQQNELQVASGLKMDASMLGRSYGTTETQITVIFTKLLAQIKNIQSMVKRNLEFGYTLDLRLAGFDFKSLRVTFNQSTAQDELKYQQAQEIKIRNASDLYYDGIITLDEYANMMGYDFADQDEVRFLRNKVVPLDVAEQGGTGPAGAPTGSDPAAVARRKQKGASAKRVRDKNKPQPKKLN